MSGLDHEKFLMILSIDLTTQLGSLKMDIQYDEIDDRTELNRVSLPPRGRNFVFRLVNLDLTFSIGDSHSCLLGLPLERGTPK